MAEHVASGEDDESKMEEGMESSVLSRKEKRKAAKKQKRKQMRRQAAAEEREEEEARMNNPEEQMRMRLMEEEEAERAERARKEFEERERLWIEAMEKKMKEAEEEEQRKELEESERKKVENDNEFIEDDDCEYIEEGPAEIIWQGNEIIVKKKRVKVAKKAAEQQIRKEDTDRPTSNPLPPQSEAFTDYRNASIVSAQQVFDDVAQQIPNFGTEQDKAHCPFHFKTGACRFGQRCSRVHFYPDKSCTLLIKNMYNGPGLAWEQDEGLEYTDEEVEHCYEEFYEDVHTEFLKFGEIVNFKVCKNGSFHLRGNVYVHYKSLDDAVLACHSINGRYFAGKQVKCEFVSVTRWKVAICGEYMKSRLKTCSHGTACNFIHCFRNPGGDYEWADWDKPPPKYWVKKIAALFGFSDDTGYDKQMEQESLGRPRSSCRRVTADAEDSRYRVRRSRSKDMDHLNRGTDRSLRDENDVQKSKERRRSDGRKRKCEERMIFEDSQCRRSRTHETDSDGDWSDRDGDTDGHNNYIRRSSKQQNAGLALLDDHGDSRNRALETDSDIDWLDKDKGGDKLPGHLSQSSRHRKTVLESSDVLWDCNMATHETDSYGDCLDGDRDRQSGRRRKSSRHITLEVSNDHGDSKSSTHESDSFWSDRGRDREKGNDRHRQKNRHRGHARKTSRHQSKFPDDPCDGRNRAYDTNSDAYWSDRDRDGEGHRGHKRDSSKNQNKLNNHDKRKNKRHYIDFIDDSSDRERDRDGDRDGGRHLSKRRKHAQSY
ncbi:zinc finger CCCH domain-containing protein 5 [Malania oleifera]|uniref:zinc finger CCCH domain-containing protein 5 n=1 Tax=Malania oleifera TaxID=397392 RepID=UPI0025AE06F8|nr:zinc finger CCCH domain-containing protein 5 [Malania oleifera]